MALSNKNQIIDEWAPELEELKKELASLESEVTNGKSFGLIVLYTLLSAALTPFASFFLSVAIFLIRGTGINLENNPDLEDCIRGIVSAALALPLWLSNRLVKPRRTLVLNLYWIPYITILGIFLFVEYMGFFMYFTDSFTHRQFDIYVFLNSIFSDLKTQWLYAIPLVVIWLNLFQYSGYITLSKESYELWEAMPDEIKFVVYAILSIVLAIVIKFIIIVGASVMSHKFYVH